MKTIVFATALVACVTVFSGTALAGGRFCPSGMNGTDCTQYLERNQAAYDLNRRVDSQNLNDGYGGYNNGFASSGAIVASQGSIIVAPQPCHIFCGSRKPKDGELRTLASGKTVSYDKATNSWPVVDDPKTPPRGVYSDRDVYIAMPGSN